MLFNDPSYLIGNVIDGDFNTRAQTTAAVLEWYQIDLLDDIIVAEVILYDAPDTCACKTL